MNDTEASFKMAKTAGYIEVMRIQQSKIMVLSGDTLGGNELFTDWNPKENIAQAMEVLAGIGDKGYFWELTNNGDIEGHICQIWAKRSEYSASFDSLSHCIFTAVKKYLKEVSK